MKKYDLSKNESVKIEAKEYFDFLKDSKQKSKEVDLISQYNKLLKLIPQYQETGQYEGLRQLLFLLEVVEREIELLDLGFNDYIYKDTIAKYIESVAQKDVKMIELSKYPRVIPDEIIKNIKETEDIFDDFIVVFTDYTGEVEEINDRVKVEKDPILFGVFVDKDRNSTLYDKFYFLGDWIDEYCDLTLSKLVYELSKEGIDDVVNEIDPRNKDIQEEIKELKKGVIKDIEGYKKEISPHLVKDKDESVNSGFFSFIKNSKLYKFFKGDK